MTNWEKSQIADRLRANVGEWINSHTARLFLKTAVAMNMWE